MKNRNFQRLGRWIRRAQPPRGDLVRALIGGFVASATNVALLVGAIALLVESATRPGLKAVAAVLVVIELFAFVRSPLRYFERMSAHRLGYAAVTHWRQWLVRVVAGMKFSQWRQHATGDLLERALDDTDQLQDLWLRFFIPLVTTILVMGASDVAVMVLPPHGRWWPVVLTLVLVQVAALTALCTTSGRSFALEARLRQARGDYRALLVEAIAVVPELTLLHRLDEITLRTSRAVDALRHAEVQQRRNYRTQDVVVVVASLLAIATLSLRPTTSSVWLTVASMVALATYELLATVRNALRAAVEVSGGGERLDAVDARLDPRSAPWPLDTTLRLEDVSIVEAGRTLLRDVSYSFPPGTKVAIVGESGTGKSTLLRDMAGLDTVEAGRVTIGATTIDQIDEATLRQHLSYLAGEPGLTRGFAVDVLSMGRSMSRDVHQDLVALGVAHEPSTHFGNLSRGERARVAIARSIATDPDLLLLDEPTAGLGAEETKRVLALLDSTRATVLIVTHDVNVMNWCEAILELRDQDLHVLDVD